MAIDQFLMLTDITGESIDAVHVDEIDILTWDFGASQSGNTHLSTGGGSGKVSVQDLILSKYIDRSSSALFQACCTGKHIPEAKLTVRKAGDNPLEYFIIEMEDCLITNISTGGSGGEDRVTENISINFAKFRITYTPQLIDGSGDAEVEMGFNIAENTAW